MKFLKYLGIYLLGLITIPIITFFYFQIFDSDSEGELHSGVTIPEVENMKNNEYTIPEGQAWILGSTGDIVSFLNKAYGDSSKFVGIDFSQFELQDEIYYKNVMGRSLYATSILDNEDRNDYLLYLSKYKPPAKCRPFNRPNETHTYKLSVELKGESLKLPNFEFGNLNYSNPGCFNARTDKITLENFVEIVDGTSEIPFIAKVRSKGKENNTFKFKLVLKDKNNKLVARYPETGDFVSHTLVNLATSITIEKKLKLKGQGSEDNEEEITINN